MTLLTALHKLKKFPEDKQARATHNRAIDAAIAVIQDSQIAKGEGYTVFVPQGIRNHEHITSKAEFERTLELLTCTSTSEELDTHLHCGFGRILDALKIVTGKSPYQK